MSTEFSNKEITNLSAEHNLRKQLFYIKAIIDEAQYFILSILSMLVALIFIFEFGKINAGAILVGPTIIFAQLARRSNRLSSEIIKKIKNE